MDNRLDELDYKILELLTQDGRMSFADMGRSLSMSRVAVRERVNKLVDCGVIERFSIIVNPHKIGLRISVFFEIDVHPQKMQQVANNLSENQYVLSINQMTGPNTLHVHAALRDNAHLEEFLRKNIYSLSGINSVNSYVLLRGFKPKTGGIKIG